jgi:hypothetical protein
MSSNSPIDPVARRPFIRVILVRAVFIGAVLLTLLAAFFLEEKVRGDNTWQRYQAEARARGVKLTMAEYVPPPVPEEQNFASIPLFQESFRPSPPANPLALPEAPGVKQPPLGAAFKGEPIDLAAWQKFFVATKALPDIGESAAADVLKALERYAPQVAQLRAAGKRPESRFPVRYEDGAAATLPHLVLCQSAARLFALRLAAHLALGQSGEAYEDFQDGLRLYAALVKEPTLISGLVRLSALSVMENAVWAGLARHQWADAELQKIAADLADIRLMDDYALAFGSERGASNLIHDGLVKKGASELAALLPLNTDTNPQPSHWAAAAFVSLYPTGWLRLSQTRANGYFDEMSNHVSHTPPRFFLDRPTLSAAKADANFFERLCYFLFFILTPSLDEVERTYAYGQTLLDQTRLGCSLERYRIDHGAFPASLDVLAPDFRPALPCDVLNGEPLHYRVDAEGGYLLYSVARNLADDGGKSDAKVGVKQQPDWVWSIPGK